MYYNRSVYINKYNEKCCYSLKKLLRIERSKHNDKSKYKSEQKNSSIYKREKPLKSFIVKNAIRKENKYFLFTFKIENKY